VAKRRTSSCAPTSASSGRWPTVPSGICSARQWLFPDPERYVEPLREMGAQGLSEPVMRDRLHGFVEAALAG
jgi:hypothetical protein